MAIRRLLTCSKCHKTIDLDFYGNINPFALQMQERKLCCDCLFWTNVIEHPEADTYIISGGLWKISLIEDMTDKRHITKDMVFLLNLKTRKVILGSNAIYRGTVPEEFKKELPDQMKFISHDTYLKILKYVGEKCQSKGCFDRYHCYWYDMSLEAGGPWNKIPLNYVVGCEQCISFIDKQKMYDCNKYPPCCPADIQFSDDRTNGKD